MRLLSLSTSGLKAHDLDLDFASPVTVIIGENGQGKSSVLEALQLLAHGAIPGLPKTADGVMRAARGNTLEIEARFELDDGKIATVSRAWKRDRKGSVSESITQTGLGPKCSTREARVILSQKLGALAEAWAPGELLGLSAAKMRARLLHMIPAKAQEIAAWVPENCPDWAQPAEGEALLDWISTAIHEAKERVSAEQAEVRRLEAQLEGSDDGWSAGTPAEVTRASLSKLRVELLQIRSAEQAQARLKDSLARLERVRTNAAASPEPLLARLGAELTIGAAAAITQERGQVEPMLDTLESEAAKLDLALENLREVDDTAPEDVARAKAELEGLLRAESESKSEVDGLRGRIEVLSGACPLPHCPDCGVVLEDYWRAAKGAAEAAFETARQDQAKIFTAREVGERKLHMVQGGQGKSKLRFELEAKTVKIEKLQARIAPLPSAKETQLAKADAESWAFAARQSESARAVLDEAEIDVEILKAEVESLAQARAPEVIEAEIAALEAQLEETGRLKARAQDHGETKAVLARVERKEAEAKAWLALFAGLQTKALAESKGWLEDRLSETSGSAVVVELIDVRENPTCRITVDGIDVSTLSGGERARFLSSMVVGLAGSSDAEFRPVLLDAFESISQGHRKRFLEALVTAVNEKRIDQAVIVGCCDTVPDINGITVITLGATAVVQLGRVIDITEVRQ